ncbi:unnamed protein product [Linum trigynum]|uniref:Uncharacterized protein n=1 Tax=Linum trigynum TaxID=586398 RepID=A0AAV2GVA0_9ROSI
MLPIHKQGPKISPGFQKSKTQETRTKYYIFTQPKENSEQTEEGEKKNMKSLTPYNRESDGSKSKQRRY